MTPPPAVDSTFVLDTLADLVRINSINPDVAPGAPGESEIARYVMATLGACGVHAERVEPVAGRPSVVGTIPGTGGGRSLMLNAHFDTVGIEGMPDPFSAAVSEGRLYGRGAYDMKGALAACLGAIHVMARAERPLAGDLVVAAVSDEEYASVGTASVIEHVRVDGAIVTEPTHLRVCLAHKGFAWIRVTTRGRAAHGSRFEEGVDANLRMGRILSELAELELRVRTGRRHHLVGPGSIHAPLVQGGSGISTYADRCELYIERRTIPGETAQQVEQEIRDIVSRIRSADPDFAADVEVTLVRDPFEVPAQAAIVRAVDTGVREVTGEEPRHIGDTPWMDSALLSAAGVETVVIGPTGGGAHAAEEWVDVDSVITLARILVEAARTYCNAPREDAP